MINHASLDKWIGSILFFQFMFVPTYIHKMNQKTIYLDNNATTNMPQEVCQEMILHCNMGNPSASYKSAKRAQALMDNFRKEVALLCGFDLKDYYILFTSGASESNSMIISRVCDAYSAIGKIPHIIASAIEHKSIIENLKYYVELGRATATYINPIASGHILPQDVEAAIQPDTALVVVMYANNEIGSINNIKAIAEAAHRHSVPFYTDATQSFGKYGLQPNQLSVDAFGVSFHKLYGPVGCGLLVIRRKWVEGYGIKSLIFGTQNDHLRGGTENIPAIAASRLALSINMQDRKAKNKRLIGLKQFIIDEIRARAPSRTYAEYINTPSNKEIEVIFFDDAWGRSSAYLANTIFLSIIKRSEPPMCNTKFKETLACKGIIISVGSACNTSSAKASHVLYALGADNLIRSGALRISLGDYNTKEECLQFVQTFLSILANCVKQNAFKK